MLINNVIRTLIIITIAVSSILFAYAGFLYITAMGSEERIRKAHGIFRTVAIGLGFMLAAWLIVKLITDVLIDESLGIETFLEE